MASVAGQEENGNANDEALFKKLDTYPWSSDEEFQAGLRAIVDNSNVGPRGTGAVVLQARCFYYSRKFDTPVDFPAYQRWHEAQVNATPSVSAESSADSAGTKPAGQSSPTEKPPYPLSFNRLVELITEGKEVPGVKEIPDTLWEGQASQSTATQRRKPWEKD